MSTRSKSPSRRQLEKEKKKQKQLGRSNGDWENDEMSHNRLDGRHASDYDYFGEIEPKILELKNAQEAIRSESKIVEAVLGTIIVCLKEHGDAVSVVGENMEREQDRVDEIKDLKTTIRLNRRVHEEEMTVRDKEIEDLKEAAMAGQRKENELKEQESQLVLKYQEKVKTLRTAEEARRGELDKASQRRVEQEIQQQVGVYSSKAEMLEQQTMKLEMELNGLKEENRSLKKRVDEKDLALEGLQARYNVLVTGLREGRNEFADGEQPEEFYQQGFTDIETKLREFVTASFGELTDDTLHKFQSISERLISNAPIFANTPFSNTSCSMILRSAKAQNVILEEIRSSIWQPFYSGVFHDPPTQQVLNGIYSTLANRGPRSQSIWRLLSVESMDILANGENPNMTYLVDNILKKLEPLVCQEGGSTLKGELESLFHDAAKLWSIAQKDRNLIEIDWKPDSDDQNGWVEDISSQDYVPEVEQLPKDLESIQVLTFPKVLRYKYCTDPMAVQKDEGKSSASVLHRGTAIFSNSAILHDATMEREEQEHEMREAIYKATTKARSPSTTLHQDPTLMREMIRKGKTNREPLRI